MPLVGSIFAASLLGSPHCAAMCGGFAGFYAGGPGVGRNRLPLIAYNGGRLLSYGLLGGVAGAVGAGVDMAGRLAGVTRLATVLAGLLMAAWGLLTLLPAAGFRSPLGGATHGAARRLLGPAIRRMQDHPPVARAGMLGVLTTLLPCGWLYAFVAAAAGTGSPVRGALVMAVFWLGTVPMLAGIGLAVQRAAGPLRQRLPMVTAAVLVVLGLLTAAGRMRLDPIPGSTPGLHDHR